ncbi:MAG: hypothetical protein R3F59_34540 [Myxococcota bacterium]
MASLQKHVEVPDTLHDARWTARPVGVTSGVPGPTDLELLAWFPVADADRAAVEASLGAPLGPPAEVRVPAALAGALPDGAIAGREGEVVVLEGTPWPTVAFENLLWHGAWAVWTDGGIAVWLHTR